MLFSSKENAYCLLDENRTILFSTPAWQDALRGGDIFTVHGGRLVPSRNDIEIALKYTSENIDASPEHLSASNLRLSSGPRSERYVFVPEGDNSLRNVSFRNLGVGEGEDTPSNKSHILVEIKKPTPLLEELKDILQSHYGLSNGEARLAYDLASSGSLPDTLANLGITRNTAKTHLRRIYEKTATQSQLELTHVIHSLSSLF
ncbi:helix-turn-helix transcriptional regulator [Roseibium algae]|uniref:Helix-turn-helix transcriptional regulator n=1 Tax=Roseibium algae TaxID=3123038 RepID=A0ABU8TGY1_9HYPH